MKESYIPSIKNRFLYQGEKLGGVIRTDGELYRGVISGERRAERERERECKMHAMLIWVLHNFQAFSSPTVSNVLFIKLNFGIENLVAPLLKYLYDKLD
jgi:hypothetical protein